MTAIKHSLDEPFMMWWATRIGQVVMNFSGLEFESYLWLSQLSEDPKRIPEWTGKLFGPRVKEIIAYIAARAYTKEWESESTAAWQEAAELAKKRNRIAHNPLLFGRTSGKGEGEPDFIGIIDMRYPNKAEPFLKKEEISATVHRIKDLALILAALREEWCSARDKLSEAKNSGGTQ